MMQMCLKKHKGIHERMWRLIPYDADEPEETYAESYTAHFKKKWDVEETYAETHMAHFKKKGDVQKHKGM